MCVECYHSVKNEKAYLRLNRVSEDFLHQILFFQPSFFFFSSF